MGGHKRPSKTALAGEEAIVVQTMGGRMHVRWDETARATPHGQLVFFAEFLATAGRLRSSGGAMPAELYQPECEQ